MSPVPRSSLPSGDLRPNASAPAASVPSAPSVASSMSAMVAVRALMMPSSPRNAMTSTSALISISASVLSDATRICVCSLMITVSVGGVTPCSSGSGWISTESPCTACIDPAVGLAPRSSGPPCANASLSSVLRRSKSASVAVPLRTFCMSCAISGFCATTSSMIVPSMPPPPSKSPPSCSWFSGMDSVVATSSADAKISPPVGVGRSDMLARVIPSVLVPHETVASDNANNAATNIATHARPVVIR